MIWKNDGIPEGEAFWLLYYSLTEFLSFSHIYGYLNNTKKISKIDYTEDFARYGNIYQASGIMGLMLLVSNQEPDI